MRQVVKTLFAPHDLESSFKTGGYSHGGSGDAAETNVCFPWILDVVNLAAFDFYKVIESFIKADPTLSKDIVKHLETCENLIMERIAWRTVSLVFQLVTTVQLITSQRHFKYITLIAHENKRRFGKVKYVNLYLFCLV